MREIRLSGSEGGVAQPNAPSLPLHDARRPVGAHSARSTRLFVDKSVNIP